MTSSSSCAGTAPSLAISRELGAEGSAYILKFGREGTGHVEEVLEYNQDPDHLRNLLLYRLTLEAQKRIAATPVAKREIMRRLKEMTAEPLLPAECRLIACSLVGGVLLLGVLVWLSYTFFPAQ